MSLLKTKKVIMSVCDIKNLNRVEQKYRKKISSFLALVVRI